MKIMASLNAYWIFLTVVSLQGILEAQAKPTFFGVGCSELEYGYGGCEGCGGFGEKFHEGYGKGCGPVVVPPPPFPYLPVHQPIPVKVPGPSRQSVTIPNIILALLPPNNKPPSLPKPTVRPMVPLPHPYPMHIPTPCIC